LQSPTKVNKGVGHETPNGVTSFLGQMVPENSHC